MVAVSVVAVSVVAVSVVAVSVVAVSVVEPPPPPLLPVSVVPPEPPPPPEPLALREAVRTAPVVRSVKVSWMAPSALGLMMSGTLVAPAGMVTVVLVEPSANVAAPPAMATLTWRGPAMGLPLLSSRLIWTVLLAPVWMVLAPPLMEREAVAGVASSVAVPVSEVVSVASVGVTPPGLSGRRGLAGALGSAGLAGLVVELSLLLPQAESMNAAAAATASRRKWWGVVAMGVHPFMGQAAGATTARWAGI